MAVNSKDIESLWKQYSEKGAKKGISVVLFFESNGVPYNSFEKWYKKKYSNTGIMQCAGIKTIKNYQTFSQSQYNLLKATYKKKNVFYAPFVLKDYGAPKMTPNEEYVTFLNFGRIRGYKCIDVLIRAAEKVQKETQKKFKVIIAGGCNDWINYQKFIKHPSLFELPIENIPNDQIPDLFGRTHYTVLPYQDIVQNGVLMVCINYSKPSILRKLPAFEEILTDGKDSFFIDPANED